MRVESAKFSLQGGRQNNQDRVDAIVGERATLLIACDGMGGHAEGARAAEIALRAVQERFVAQPQPLLDPLGFLHLSLGLAHERLVAFGAALPIEQRPRATCALGLVQRGAGWWAHVGDSRVYHLRAGRVLERTRDHSHVELLLRGGVIEDDQVSAHPMRNFVESCLGGDPILPEMTLSPRRPLAPGDVLLACTDGFWSGLTDEAIGAAFGGASSLQETLGGLVAQALRSHGRASDNVSVTALRWAE